MVPVPFQNGREAKDELAKQDEIPQNELIVFRDEIESMDEFQAFVSALNIKEKMFAAEPAFSAQEGAPAKCVSHFHVSPVF